jgi:hypothetical protein
MAHLMIAHAGIYDLRRATKFSPDSISAAAV